MTLAKDLKMDKDTLLAQVAKLKAFGSLEKLESSLQALNEFIGD